MNYGFRDSFLKFFNIVAFTSTQPLDWEIVENGKSHNFSSTGVSKLELGESFFRNDRCLACGKCCSSLGFYLFLTISDFYHNTKQHILKEINIRKLRIFTTSFTVESGCPFMIDKICNIHAYKPIHCRFPHIKVRQVGNKGLLYKAPYSRRWAKRVENRCPIDSFDIYNEEGRETDITTLYHLARVQEDLNIDNSLVLNVIEKLRRLGCPSVQLTLI